MSVLNVWLNGLGLQQVKHQLLEVALTHSSYKGMGHKGEDNERLEFLGDAVLGLISAESLYKEGTFTEGKMTELRKSKVSNNVLANMFNKLGMQQHIKTAKNLGLSNKVKADFIEALFGAVFADKGYTKCVQLWNKIHQGNGNNNKKKKKAAPKKAPSKSPLKNAKSVLLEFCQDHKFTPPEYEELNKQGPDHDPVYTVRVTLHAAGNPNEFRKVFKVASNQKKVSAKGIGKKKKEAETRAAEQICKKVGLKFA